MGSLVISELAHDSPHHPWPTMLAGEHQAEPTPSDSTHRTSTPSRSSQHPSTQSQYTSSTSTPHSSGPSRPGMRSTPIHAQPGSEYPQRGDVSHHPTPPSPRLSPSHHDDNPRSLPLSNTNSSVSSSAPPSPSQSHSIGESASASPPRIKVRDLSQIQSFVSDDASSFGLSRPGSRVSQQDSAAVGPQYEISEMPVVDIIEMVAGLLTKITTTNDRQHEHLHSNIPPTEGAVNLQTSSVLAFHGKNKPNISILSYLSRIHKYCPTTYEVFVSLLVYFDRMTERVNSGPLQSLRQANQSSMERMSLSGEMTPNTEMPVTREHQPTLLSRISAAQSRDGLPSPPLSADSPSLDPYALSHLFVVDSFNIHRLVIAGVTCASKFFSDVFYTNSRYAKVGGLPQAELNHLELQFLVLNDFRLSIPVEELEAYGTMLVEFYAREVMTQLQNDPMEDVHATAG